MFNFIKKYWRLLLSVMSFIVGIILGALIHAKICKENIGIIDDIDFPFDVSRKSREQKRNRESIKDGINKIEESNRGNIERIETIIDGERKRTESIEGRINNARETTKRIDELLDKL